MADATIEELWADHAADWVPSDTDLESWVEVDPATDDTTATFVGLFGADLTDFLEACVTSDDCDDTDYDAYSGWAFGVEWTPAVVPDAPGPAPSGDRLRQATAGAINTLVFEDRAIAVQVTWDGEGNNVIEADVSDVEEITDAAPAADDIDGESKEPFAGFFTGELSDLDGPQYAVRFQEDEDEIYYEVDSTSTVWAYLANAAGVDTEVTWAGAAQLTAAAGAVAVALLF